MSISFTVPGRVPSKSNFRYSPTEKSRRAWQRIVQYQQEVGMAALAAGGKWPRHGRSRARLKVLLVNQRVDLDNALKAPIDGLKGVVFPDDSPEFLGAVQVCWTKDDGPARVEYRIEWEDG